MSPRAVCPQGKVRVCSSWGTFYPLASMPGFPALETAMGLWENSNAGLRLGVLHPVQRLYLMQQGSKVKPVGKLVSNNSLSRSLSLPFAFILNQ